MAEFATSAAMFEYLRPIFAADILGIPPAAEIDFGSYTGEPKAGDIVALINSPLIVPPFTTSPHFKSKLTKPLPN